MRTIHRLALALTLILAVSAGAFAQETSTAAETDLVAPVATEVIAPDKEIEAIADPENTQATAPTIWEVRERFTSLLRQHPRELSSILVLDPTLLSNESFMEPYAEVARFAAAHPEIQRNPRFYLAEFQRAPNVSSPADELFEGFLILSVVALIAFALSWIIRTIIEQKRWKQLSRNQSEVHNRILDRFGTSEEVLEYIRTPAGSSYLSAAPIVLRATPATHGGAPINRIIWSVQLGVAVAVAGVGLIIAGAVIRGESSGFYALGVIALTIGGGFVASAFVSLTLSRRLGLWQDVARPEPDSNILKDPGHVR